MAAPNDRTSATPARETGRQRMPAALAGDLGAGTPANVDVHKLGQEDRPQEDWC